MAQKAIAKHSRGGASVTASLPKYTSNRDTGVVYCGDDPGQLKKQSNKFVNLWFDPVRTRQRFMWFLVVILSTIVDRK